MPRSFLVKRSPGANEDRERRADTLSCEIQKGSELEYPSQYLEYAAALLALGRNKDWGTDYELEKAYWFDISPNNVSSILFENKTSCISNEIGVQTKKKSEGKPKEIEEHKDDVVSDQSKHVQSKLSENLEERLQQMLSEDEIVITKNICQFLENNGMGFHDIAEETGLSKEEVQGYIELTKNFTSDNKRELYSWYLSKILRPSKSADESYTCYKCGKIFTYKSYLERHIKYVCPDSTGRTWKCTFCGKAFQYPCYLRRHIRSHTGESPYKCDQCDRAFVRSTDLQRHIRNHTGEKPYRCSQCSRAFARSTDLKRHMRTHTGEKPYKCWQCGKSFSQSGSLQTHLHTHNKEASSNRNMKKRASGC